MWLEIGSAIKHWGIYLPEKTALIVGKNKYSYKNIFDKATSISNFFSKCGNGRIALLLKNKYKYISCISGLNLINRSVVLLNPYSSSDSLCVNIEDSSPDFIIADSETIDALKNIKGNIIDVDKIPLESTPDFNDIPRKPEWGVLFSSGSTGVSKAIVYERQSMLSELLAWILELGITRASVFYIGRPICYTGGLVLALATLLIGGTIIMNTEDDDTNFSNIWLHYQSYLQENLINFAFFVPDQIRLFVKTASKIIGGPIILTMGAPISAEEKIKANRILNSPIIESWGNTEGLGTITDIHDLEIRPKSIGRPFLTEEVFIVSENLEHCASEQIGRLAGSNETMFLEYANRPDATKRIKRNDMIISDDYGYRDNDHYFYIEGRMQESFILNGKTIFLKDIENDIRKIRDITECCVLVFEENEEPIITALISSNSLEKDKIIEQIKIMEINLHQLHFINKLPRLASGKIDRLSAKKIVLENGK